MMIEIGHFALVLCFSMSLVQVFLPVLGIRYKDERFMEAGQSLTIVCFLLSAIAFGILVRAHVQSDFSVLNVWEHSHSQEPMLYKFTGSWASHEGSMLLWVCLLFLFNLLFLLKEEKKIKAVFLARVLSLQGFMGAAFLLFVILTSNPFIRINPAPIEGKDLNPLLQDIGLAIHPPFLFLGYAGFSVCFFCALSAMIAGEIDHAWSRLVRFWVLLAWTFLTGGITAGSWWAYYELGWGGFWFWDPVENLSLMPWLTATALLHCLAVMEKRQALNAWSLLLSVMTFSLSLLGFFLVRSGVLTSVHTFALDPGRGVFMLLILAVFAGGGFFLFAIRGHLLTKKQELEPFSREGALVMNNLFILTATTTVLIGTLYPLIVESFLGKKISVGAPFFNHTFIPLMLPLLVVLPFGPLLAWKKGNVKKALAILVLPLGFSLLSIIIVLALAGVDKIPASLFVGLSIWIILGSLVDPFSRVSVQNFQWKSFGKRFLQKPWALSGRALAHCGVGILVLGLVSDAFFKKEVIVALDMGEKVKIGSYSIQFEGMRMSSGPNYTEQEGSFVVIETGQRIYASRRFYSTRQVMTTEAGIRARGLGQFYIALGDQVEKNGKRVIYFWWKPFISLIWIGGVVMMIGAIFSLMDITKFRKKIPGFSSPV